MKWFLIAFTVLIGSCGDILCAKGMSEGRELEVRGARSMVLDVEYIVTRRLVILGWICYAASFFSLVALLSVAKMTVAIPATAFSFVIDTLGARFILREHIPWRRWIGVVCVTAGVLLVIRPAQNARPLAGPGGAGRAAVKTGKNEPGHYHRGPGQLDPQRAAVKVFAKPGGTPAGDCPGAQKYNYVAYPGDGLNHGG